MDKPILIKAILDGVEREFWAVPCDGCNRMVVVGELFFVKTRFTTLEAHPGFLEPAPVIFSNYGCISLYTSIPSGEHDPDQCAKAIEELRWAREVAYALYEWRKTRGKVS